MKSTLAHRPRHKGVYMAYVFEAIQNLGFKYYSSATDYIVLLHDGRWVDYETVQKKVMGLPPIPYKD